MPRERILTTRTPRVATMTTSLVGRERELRALELLMEEARHGQPRFAVLTGDPGIGKSSILTEFARRATAVRGLVLGGSATELERVFPFGLFLDAFDGHLGSLDQ